MAEILNVVQVFTPAHAVTVCYCCYCCSAASKQKMAKNPGKTRKYLGFPGYFRVLPALDAGDRRGSLPGLPYCCSAGLTLATVVGEPHCCSVVTVNTSNTVQLLTLGNPGQLSRHIVVRTPRGAAGNFPISRCPNAVDSAWKNASLLLPNLFLELGGQFRDSTNRRAPARAGCGVE